MDDATPSADSPPALAAASPSQSCLCTPPLSRRTPAEQRRRGQQREWQRELGEEGKTGVEQNLEMTPRERKENTNNESSEERKWREKIIQLNH